jgi:hypothetical protein
MGLWFLHPGRAANVSRRRHWLLRAVCRVVGHRWKPRLNEEDRPYLHCTRCSAGWEFGRPIPEPDQPSEG